MWSKIFNIFKLQNITSKSAYVSPLCKVGTAEEIGLDLSKVLKSKYASSVKRGEVLNSGHTANVYTIEGWEKSYVARVEENSVFSPESLKLRKSASFDPVVAKNSNGSVSIQKRIAGEPLYGAGWYDRQDQSTEPIEIFRETYKKLNELPDSTFEEYMYKVIELREQRFDIDRINPNNFLLDLKNKTINIIDIERGYNGVNFIQIGDFFPFLNHHRLIKLMANMNKSERDELQNQVKTFVDRMIKIAKNNGIGLKMEDAAGNVLFEDIYKIYKNDQNYIDKRIAKLKEFYKIA